MPLQGAGNYILVIPYKTTGLVFASNFTSFVYLQKSRYYSSDFFFFRESQILGGLILECVRDHT